MFLLGLRFSPIEQRVVSSAQLLKHTLSGKRNMLLIYMLNTRGPSIDPCGTPAIIYEIIIHICSL